MSKYPACDCPVTRYQYHRKRYKNGTLHLMRQCPQCGKIAQNPMPQRDYDKNWVDTLPIMQDGVVEHTAQSRADAAMARLQNHIASRNTGGNAASVK